MAFCSAQAPGLQNNAFPALMKGRGVLAPHNPMVLFSVSKILDGPVISRSRFMLQLTCRIREVVKVFAAPPDRRCGAALHRCCCCCLISSAAALPPPPAAAAASSAAAAVCSTPAASPPHDASALTSLPLLTEAAACCSLAAIQIASWLAS